MEAILKEIVNTYKNIWQNPRQFKSVLTDLVPDKMLRNLILISAEEHIPQSILLSAGIEETDIFRFKKILINASGCSDEKASTVIGLWLEAFSIQVKRQDIKLNTLLFQDEGSIKIVNELHMLIQELPMDVIGVQGDVLDKLRDDQIDTIDDLLQTDYYSLCKCGLKPDEIDQIVSGLLKLYIPQELELYYQAFVYSLRQYCDLPTRTLIGNVFGYPDPDEVRIRSLYRIAIIKAEIETPRSQLEDKRRAERLQELFDDEERKQERIKKEIESVLTPELKTGYFIEEHINKANRHYEQGEYLAFLDEFEQAVEWGFNGDYSPIGILYLQGDDLGIPFDKEKGKEWLVRFYDDYKRFRLHLNGKEGVLKTCHQLGVICYWDYQTVDRTNAYRESELNMVIEFFEEAVDIGAEIKEIEASEELTSILFNIGCCFYYGEIRSSEHGNAIIGKNLYYAKQAFKQAARLGHKQAEKALDELIRIYDRNDPYIEIHSSEESREILLSDTGLTESTVQFLKDEKIEKIGDLNNVVVSRLNQLSSPGIINLFCILFHYGVTITQQYEMDMKGETIGNINYRRPSAWDCEQSGDKQIFYQDSHQVAYIYIQSVISQSDKSSVEDTISTYKSIVGREGVGLILGKISVNDIEIIGIEEYDSITSRKKYVFLTEMDSVLYVFELRYEEGFWIPEASLASIFYIIYSIKRKRDLDLKRISIKQLLDNNEISVRTYNCLKAAHINSMGKLSKQTSDKLMGIKGFGVKCMSEIKDVLDKYSVSSSI